jgi:hypothetical protein
MQQFFRAIRLTIITTVVCCSACVAQQSTGAFTKTILDFGAIPNDGKDDSWAFIKAGKYFSNLWDINGVPLKPGAVNFQFGKTPARLEIPSGIYHVGKQIKVPEEGLATTYGEIFGYKKADAPIKVASKSAFRLGLELIRLSHPTTTVDGIMITGTGKSRPVIKYNDGLYLGYFNSRGEEMFLTDSTYNSGKWAVTIGDFISTSNVKNIGIENIEVDGNNRSTALGGKTIYGGAYASHLIQMGGSGAYLLNTQNIRLKNLNFHHMTMDGVVLQDYYKNPVKFPKQSLTNFIMDSCNLNYNRRQGFSWVGGRSIKVTNSTFNFTGTTVDGKAIGNPGAGVDIEPEADNLGNLLWCMDAEFSNSQFVDNYGCALLNDATAGRTRNVLLNQCVFHDVTGYSVWVKGAQFVFRNSKIWGGFIYGNEGKIATDATRFYNCDFADEEVPGKPGKFNEQYALIESWNTSQKMLFENCRFRVLHPKQRMFALYNSSTTEADFYRFINCKFSFGEKAVGENTLFGVIFDGNTLFENFNKKDYTAIHLNGVIVTGSVSASKPFKFSSVGRIQLFPANSNGKHLTQFVLGRKAIGTDDVSGFLRVEIGNETCLYAYVGQTIDVGSNTTFINKQGGQLAIITGAINNAGKIFLEDGSYTAFFQPININSKQQAEFYVMPAAKFGVHPNWKKPLDGLGNGTALQYMKLNSHTKFKGGNKEIPAGRNAE